MVYRERDCIEKLFRMMKQDIQLLPLNVRKELTMRGFIFVTFISLVFRMRLLKRMKDTDILEEYILDSLLLEPAKIKKIRLDNGETITTEVSKKQGMILESLGLCA